MTKDQLIAEESARFIDQAFGQLDLSGSPDWRKPLDDKFEQCDRSGLNNVTLTGTNQLKALVENPDIETLERLAEETQDPKLIERIQDDQELREAKAFMHATPSYHRTDQELRHDQRLLGSARPCLHQGKSRSRV
jgi:hypothetical protein